MEKIKRFKKVTEWNDIGVMVLIASIIILFLSVAYIVTNWDEMGTEENIFYLITTLLCFGFGVLSIIVIIASLGDLKSDEYFEEIKSGNS